MEKFLVTDAEGKVWQKATASGNGGNCVEVRVEQQTSA
jgi:hypothetical protein